METITGKIQKLWEKKIPNGKSMYFIDLGGKLYSAFGTIPVPINEAFMGGKIITLEYVIKGQFRNIQGIKQEPQQPPLNNFKNGGDVDIADKILAGIAGNMAKCHTATGEILGRPPKTDGEMAMQNSMFIELNKQLPRK